MEPQVFDLLRLLVENPARLVTRDEIVAAVWDGRIVSESAISARIAAARKAVGDDGKAQHVIRTHHGRGLEMVARVTASEGAGAGPQEVTDIPRVRYTTSARGHSLAYMVSGAGPPLFHIDGPPISKEKAWHLPVLRGLYVACREDHTLAQLDWAGTGLSEPLDQTLSVEENVEDMLAVADAAGIGRFALVSESGGCLEAVTMAANHPDRVSRLVMSGAYAEGRVRRERTDGPEALQALMKAGWDQPDGGLARAFMTAYFPETPIETVSQMVEVMQESSSRAFALSKREAINKASVLHLLDRVRCPTLIVQGRNDAVHPLAQARKLAAGIADAELLVLESANHLPLPGHRTWDEYLIALRSFLDG